MSNIYIHEPPTHGKVLMSTSLGELDIELWSKEAPLACRNFIQLCIDGYYTGTIFHRIIPQFMVQGGDRSGTGGGGESIYGSPFKLESHQRLRFCRRGLLATAGAHPNDNTSQFFFSLGAHEHLNRKHTIFGQVAGDTKYNLLRFNDVQTDQNDRPLNPPKILKLEILANPFPDLELYKDVADGGISIESQISKYEVNTRKSVKNLNLLSFGEELAETFVNEVDLTKFKSSHDFQQVGLDIYNSDFPDAADQKCSDDVTSFSLKEQESRITKKFQDTEQSFAKKSKPLSKVDARFEYEKLRKELRLKSQAKKNVVTSKSDTINDSSVHHHHPYQSQVNEYLNISKKLKNDAATRETNTLAMLSKFSGKLKMLRKFGEDSSESDVGEYDEKNDGRCLDPSWMTRSLVFIRRNDVEVKDVNVVGEGRWDIHDPRNSINKRRREENRKLKQRTKH